MQLSSPGPGEAGRIVGRRRTRAEIERGRGVGRLERAAHRRLAGLDAVGRVRRADRIGRVGGRFGKVEVGIGLDRLVFPRRRRGRDQLGLRVGPGRAGQLGLLGLGLHRLVGVGGPDDLDRVLAAVGDRLGRRRPRESGRADEQRGRCDIIALHVDLRTFPATPRRRPAGSPRCSHWISAVCRKNGPARLFIRRSSSAGQKEPSSRRT